jgi:hypothetical protein
MKKLLFLAAAAALGLPALLAQEKSHTIPLPDSLEQKPAASPRPKVLHAEPLFVDLIRDLGARKGEQEWNLGLGLNDKNRYDEYTALVEYEFAPVDRLGLEVELPFTFYYPGKRETRTDSLPGNRLNSLKLAAQYTFLVNERRGISLAVGYLHELTLRPFRDYGKSGIHDGHVLNPFFVAAKNWRNNWHTLLYAGPHLLKEKGRKGLHTSWQINSNLHYLIPGSRNFIGLEVNKELEEGNLSMTFRPQLRLSITENMLIGIVTGVPVKRTNDRLSTFLRFIYEPGHGRRA